MRFAERRRKRIGALAVATAMAAGIACEDPARPLPPPAGGSLSVVSDPPGADVFIDGERVGGPTPVVIPRIDAGAHALRIALRSGDHVYDYTTAYTAVVDSLAHFDVPLTLRCTNLACADDAAFSQEAGAVRFVLSAAGPPFTRNREANGVIWPSSTPNSYVAAATPVVAARAGEASFALSLWNYASPFNYWAGRPPIVFEDAAGRYAVRQRSWLVPYEDDEPALRGLAVDQEVFVLDAFPDVVLIRLEVVNISARADYRALDTGAPESGVTYTDVYLGLALDPNIGGEADTFDDLVTYLPSRDAVVAYDADLNVPGFGSWSERPALLALALHEGPGAAPRLNAWTPAEDWHEGQTVNQGYELLTATQSDPPNHALEAVGFAPDSARADYRISVTTGPFTLAPGDAQAVTLALLFAAPATGTYVSGEVMPAGDPADDTRPVLATAADMIALLDALRGRLE